MPQGFRSTSCKVITNEHNSQRTAKINKQSENVTALAVESSRLHTARQGTMKSTVVALQISAFDHSARKPAVRPLATPFALQQFHCTHTSLTKIRSLISFAL